MSESSKNPAVILLAAGCLGELMMLVIAFSLGIIDQYPFLALLGPVAGLCMVAGIGGVVAFLAQLAVFLRHRRKGVEWPATALFFVYLVGFFYVAVLYAGV